MSWEGGSARFKDAIASAHPGSPRHPGTQEFHPLRSLRSGSPRHPGVPPTSVTSVSSVTLVTPHSLRRRCVLAAIATATIGHPLYRPRTTQAPRSSTHFGHAPSVTPQLGHLGHAPLTAPHATQEFHPLRSLAPHSLRPMRPRSSTHFGHFAPARSPWSRPTHCGGGAYWLPLLRLRLAILSDATSIGRKGSAFTFSIG